MAELTKVTIPKEIAEAIEKTRRDYKSNYVILHQVRGSLVTPHHLTLKHWAFDIRGEGSPDLLMEALVNGYEIERTPHEELREYYEVIHEDIERNDYGLGLYRAEGAAEGVLKTLNILGITVEGINA